MLVRSWMVRDGIIRAAGWVSQLLLSMEPRNHQYHLLHHLPTRSRRDQHQYHLPLWSHRCQHLLRLPTRSRLPTRDHHAQNHTLQDHLGASIRYASEPTNMFSLFITLTPTPPFITYRCTCTHRASVSPKKSFSTQMACPTIHDEQKFPRPPGVS